ncbi:hypothetical protein PENSPDRAFT_568371 [Peniophora sp. CONT]|nr:hypothetical protein PENSPDRAFT_568371 [Peniophora sp. CONT]
MDAFVKVTASSRVSRLSPPLASSSTSEDLKPPTGFKPSRSATRKNILQNLKSDHNPITKSDSRERADHIVSLASGHQVGDYPRDRRPYLEVRREKLKEQAQAAPKQNKVLNGTRIYINGYLRGTTDIEMKRIVTGAGGQMLHTPSGATHILTSQSLSGSKTHKLLHSKAKSKPHVVRPEWVFDSITAGKKVETHSYSVLDLNSRMASVTARHAEGA